MAETATFGATTKALLRKIAISKKEGMLMGDTDSGPKIPKTRSPAFFKRFRESAENRGFKPGFSDPLCQLMSGKELDELRRENADRGNVHYYGLPDQSAETEGRWEVFAAPTGRLLSLIDGEHLEDERRSRVVAHVASGKARAPHIEWRQDEDKPSVLNGRHRISALAYLEYFSADIVCLPEHAAAIKSWLILE